MSSQELFTSYFNSFGFWHPPIANFALTNVHAIRGLFPSVLLPLQHFKYRSIFIRRTKKCYISFIPYEMIQKVIKSNTVIRKRLYRHLERKNLPARFCDIREYWATYMPKFLTRPEIDFLQGRVSGSVFMVNYFNPSYITDLKTRTIKASKKLLRKIRSAQ